MVSGEPKNGILMLRRLLKFYLKAHSVLLLAHDDYVLDTKIKGGRGGPKFQQLSLSKR